MKAKGILVKAAAVAAMLAMTVNVMAAGSIPGAIDSNNVTASAGTGENSGDSAIVADKAEVTAVGVTLSRVTEDMYEEEVQNTVDALNGAYIDTTVEDAFQKVYGDEIPQIDLYDEEGLEQEKMDLSLFKFLSPVMDLKFEDVVPTEEDPVEVTFTANNMTDKIEVFVLHHCDKHSWEMLETEKISDNQISAYFHSASPIALIYREKPVEETEIETDVKAP